MQQCLCLCLWWLHESEMADLSQRMVRFILGDERIILPQKAVPCDDDRLHNDCVLPLMSQFHPEWPLGISHLLQLFQNQTFHELTQCLEEMTIKSIQPGSRIIITWIQDTQKLGRLKKLNRFWLGSFLPAFVVMHLSDRSCFLISKRFTTGTLIITNVPIFYFHLSMT